MAAIAREQLAWNREQYAKNEPKIQAYLDQQVRASQQQFDISREQTAIGRQVAGQQMRIAGASEDRANEQWNRYKALFAPIEERMVSEASAEGGDAQQAAEADKARAAVASDYEAQRETSARRLAAMGVNPASGRFADFERLSANAQAADEAGAANTARTAARMRGIALRSGAAQFGRNMPQTGIAADSLALGAGSAAGGAFNPAIAGSAASVGSAAAAAAGTMGLTAYRNAGVSSALPWFGGAVDANTSAGKLLLGQYGAQMQGYQAQAAEDNGLFGSLGNIGGMILASSGKPWWLKPSGLAAARGGIIKKKGVVRKGYAGGGIVRGPGDGSVDTVPAVVDGQQPAALANGEAVLNEPATTIVGEDFVHRMNQVGLMLKTIGARGTTRAPGTYEQVPA